MKALALILILISCNRQRSLTPAEQRQITSEIKTTMENYYNDIRKYGLMAEFKYLDSSKEFFWMPPGYNSAIRYDSVSRILRNSAAQYTSINNRWITLEIIPEDHDHASYSGIIRSEMKDTGGSINIYSLHENGRLIRRKDGWKLLSGNTKMTEKSVSESKDLPSIK